MSAKPESKYILTIHRHVSPNIYWMKNNNDYVGGVPDVWYSGKKDLWVEYKYIPRTPVRAIIKPLELLSGLQADWLRERYNEGRNVAVIIGCPDGGVILTDLNWENAMQPEEFCNLILPNKKVSVWIEETVQ